LFQTYNKNKDLACPAPDLDGGGPWAQTW